MIEGKVSEIEGSSKEITQNALREIKREKSIKMSHRDIEVRIRNSNTQPFESLEENSKIMEKDPSKRLFQNKEKCKGSI